MPSPQRARSGVPLDQRSVVPSVPGIPAWGAVAVAVGATILGAVVDSFSGTDLTATFAALYLVGCVAAVLVVRHRGLFTAMAQPPLIMFFGVPIAYQFLTTDAGTSIKDIVLNVAIPLVNRFPLMIATTVLVLLIGAARLMLDRKPHKPAKSPRQRAARAPAKPTTDTTKAASGPTRHAETDDRPSTDASPWRRPRGETRPEDRPTRRGRTTSQTGRDRADEGQRRTRAQDPSRFGDDSGQHSRSSQPGRAPREQPRGSSRRGSQAPTEHTREPSHLREPLTSYSYDRDERPRPYEGRDYETRAAARRAGVDNPGLQPHPAPQVRYRDRD